MVRPDQVTLGVLIDAVPRDAVDDAIAACGVRERRSDGKLPAHVTAYLTLAMTLFPDDDYEEVATKVTGSLDRFGCWDAAWSVPTSSAITQARKRLGRKMFAELFERAGGPVAGPVGSQAHLDRGRRRARLVPARVAAGRDRRVRGRPARQRRATPPSSDTPGPGTTGPRSPRPGSSRWPSAAPTRS